MFVIARVIFQCAYVIRISVWQQYVGCRRKLTLSIYCLNEAKKKERGGERTISLVKQGTYKYFTLQYYYYFDNKSDNGHIGTIPCPRPRVGTSYYVILHIMEKLGIHGVVVFSLFLFSNLELPYVCSSGNRMGRSPIRVSYASLCLSNACYAVLRVVYVPRRARKKKKQ